jgi:hypothetical protein
MKSSIILFVASVAVARVQAQPPPRHLEAIAYDVDKKKLFVFGGVEMNEQKQWQLRANPFEWNHALWKEAKANGGPCPRRAMTTVYDQAAKCIWVIGGVGDTPKGDTVFHDAWSWRDEAWTLTKPRAPLETPVSAYDSRRKRILLYGKGKDGFELWAFSKNTFTMLSAEGPDIAGPYNIAFNPVEGTLTIPAWESDRLRIWEWTGDKWDIIECSEECPEPRTRYAFAFHPGDNSIYLFGGRTGDDRFLNDFWKWREGKWYKVTAHNPPATRASANMVSTGNGLLMYGGTVSTPDGKAGITNEMWLFTTAWTKL